MSSLLSAVASLVARRPRAATLAVLLAIAAVIGGAVAAGGTFKDDFTVPGIESQRAQDLLEERFPAQSGTQATVVFTARDGGVEERTLRPVLTALGEQPGVVAVEDPFATPGRVSGDGRTAYAAVSYDRPADDLDGKARERLEDATAALPRAGVDVAMSGEPVDGASTGGFPIGELIGLAIAIVLLLSVLRSLRAARNALGAAFAGIGLGFGALMWAAAATDVPSLAPTLAGMLGLGAGIDYALLLAARQQEELRAGHDPVEAARRANATAGHSALTAAGIVLVSISGLLVTGIPFVGRAGVAAGLVVLACALVCVVLLPARFARAGRRLLPRRERAAARPPAGRPPRAPWATRRPWLALTAAGAVCVALAAPAAGLELGQPDDRNLGTGATQRQAYDRLADGFGPGVNGPLVVAVSLPPRPRPAAAAAGPRPAGGPRGRGRRRAGRQRGGRRRRCRRHARATARRTTRRARSWTGSARTRSPPRWTAPARPRTSAAGRPATATRPRRSPGGSRCSPRRSSASRCCSCSRRSGPGGSRCCRRSSTSRPSPPPTAWSRWRSRPRPAPACSASSSSPSSRTSRCSCSRSCSGSRPTTTCSCSRACARSGAGTRATAPRSRPPRRGRGRSSWRRAGS